MLASLALVALLANAGAAPAAPRVALTTQISQAMATAYKGSTALPWAKTGAPPKGSKWKKAARTKYEAVDLAALGYKNLDNIDKRFRNVAIAVSMDWELFAADTYSLLQAAYEDVHPWRTGRVVQKNWTEAEGNRFAALTSAVGDVLLMELTKAALLGEGPLQAWPDFAHGLWLGQYQEVLAEQKLTVEDWQLFTCDAKRNPIFIQHNTTNPEVHFVPQLVWVTLPLDTAAFMGDVLIGDSKAKWVNYEKRGAALWAEYMSMAHPVVQKMLAELGPLTDIEAAATKHKPKPWKPGGVSPSPDDLIVQSQAAVSLAYQEYDKTGGSISASTYGFIRLIVESVGIGSNTSMPVAPTCASARTSSDLVLHV